MSNCHDRKVSGANLYASAVRGFFAPGPESGFGYARVEYPEENHPLCRRRRNVSRMGLLLPTVGLTFAIGVLVAEGTAVLSRQAYYDSWAMYAGGFGSIATIGGSLLAESRVRRFLLLGAIGLFCLFWLGFVEAI